LVLALAEYFGIFRPLVSLEEHKINLLDYYIDKFVKTAAINDEKITVRVNIMIVKWNWYDRHFFQYYQHGMAGHPDGDLHFAINKGFCGAIFKKRVHEVHFVDLTKMKRRLIKKTFSLSESEIESTANIKAIACIPLYRQMKSWRCNPKTIYFGVLNVDTEEKKGVEFLKSPEIQKQIKALATYAQLILV
jgi:hypothetical protein